MLALTMTIAFLSLAGLPPTAGFIGKFYLFRAAVESGLTWLAVVGVVNALIAVYYYLIVVKVIYFDAVDEEKMRPVPISLTNGWVLGLNSIIVIALGTVAAGPVYKWAVEAARQLFV
jgi:NADH-quinone oxidoreductase subunit N